MSTKNKNEWIDVANNGIDAAKIVAAKIETLAPDAWDVLVYQQQLDGVTTIGYTIMGIILFITMLKLSVRSLKKNNNKFCDALENPARPFWFAFATFLLGVFSLIMILCVSQTAVKQILNPKYYAAQDVVKLIKD